MSVDRGTVHPSPGKGDVFLKGRRGFTHLFECARLCLPSQSPAVTAPPKGEPRPAYATPALERSCLSPRERWQCRKALTERGRNARNPIIRPLYPAGRPEAVPYIRPLGGCVRVRSGVPPARRNLSITTGHSLYIGHSSPSATPFLQNTYI